MRSVIVVGAAFIALLGAMQPCPAQDPKPSRVPKLTSEDLTASRNQPSSANGTSDAPLASIPGMTRYSPGNTGVYLDLPAEPQPSMAAVYAYTDRRRIKEIHNYLAASGPMSVLITSATFLQTPAPAQLEEFEAAFMRGVREQMIGPFNRLAPKRQVSAPNPQVQFKELGNSLVSVTASFTVGGLEVVQSGLLQARDSQFTGVIASHFSNDHKSRAIAEQVLASTRFP